jgi:hypothetical protein
VPSSPQVADRSSVLCVRAVVGHEAQTVSFMLTPQATFIQVNEGHGLAGESGHEGMEIIGRTIKIL